VHHADCQSDATIHDDHPIEARVGKGQPLGLGLCWLESAFDLRLLQHRGRQIADNQFAREMAQLRGNTTRTATGIQHAHASEIEVRLTHYPDRLRLPVTDDGRGTSSVSTDAGRFVA
jgi:hypothetical protein